MGQFLHLATVVASILAVGAVASAFALYLTVRRRRRKHRRVARSKRHINLGAQR